MARIPAFLPLYVLALPPLLAREADEPGEVVDPPAPPDLEGTDVEAPRMEEIVVFGRTENLVGIADSPSEGAVGGEQIRERPLLRPGEIAETVPGVIVTQHSGSGKANQFFLRGFNLDHGTDFATYLEGVPINMPSHGHGQGYTDLNFLIPELVERVDYRKGPYHAESGDFSSAGEARIEYVRKLERSIAHVEGGSFGYLRGLLASSRPLGNGDFLYAGEVFHDDGPWSNPDNYRKLNGALRYGAGDELSGYDILFLGYHGEWNATDQIAERAVESGLISRFGSLDTTDGGESQRYGLSGEIRSGSDDSRFKALAYSHYYDLELFSNFTYFLTDPVNGDQFEQNDRRVTSGAAASEEWDGRFWWGRDVVNTLGAQLRNDVIRNGLFPTRAQDRLGTVREDEIVQTNFGLYYEHRTQWAEKLRSMAGIRGDLYDFDVNSDRSENSDDETNFIPSPKLGVVVGPWAETELYLNGGFGFHSNDARGVTSTVDPVTGAPVGRADPLVRTRGAEAGIRTAAIQDLQSTFAVWYLESDSELVFVGDAGTNEPGRASERYGIEWTNYWTLFPGLSLDFDLALSKARFAESDPAGSEIPGSIESVIATGVTVRDLKGFFGSLRLRFFGPRPLVEDGSVRSSETVLLNGQVGYRFSERLSLTCDLLNILDREDSDIEYFYTSRLEGEPAAGVDDIHFHPVYPFTVRVGLTATF